MTQANDCCSRLASLAQDDSVPFRYSSTFREWSLTLVKPDSESENDWMRNDTTLQGIAFCPYCSAELPKPLRVEWFDALEAMGFDDPRQQDIPDEFRSDRWWKERGL